MDELNPGNSAELRFSWTKSISVASARLQFFLRSQNIEEFSHVHSHRLRISALVGHNNGVKGWIKADIPFKGNEWTPTIKKNPRIPTELRVGTITTGGRGFEA